MIDKDVRLHLMFGMAVLVVAMLTFGACLLMEADDSAAETVSVERGGSTTVPVSALFSPSQISQLAECDSWTGGGATPSIYTTWNSGSISITPEGPGSAKITASSQVEPGSHLVTIYGFEEGMDHQLFTVPVEVTGTTGHTQSSALDSVDYAMWSHPASGDPTALHSPVYVREGAAVSYRLCMQSYDPVAYLTATGSSAHQSSIGGLSVSVNSSHHAVLAGTMGSEEVTLHVIYGARSYQVTFAPVTTPLTPIQILSTGGTTAIVGSEYLYEVQTVPSDARISIEGADWLSADGHRVSGTPTAPGSFTVMIHATAAGYTEAVETLVIVVSAAPPGAPSISAINYAISPSDPYCVSFVVSGENLGAVSIDFGDGQHGTGPAVTHSYGASGVYTVRAAAGQGATAVSDSVQVTLADHSPIRFAYYNQPYAYTIGMDTSAGGSPTLTGCPFLAASLDTGVIKVRGTPTSTAYVGQTYSVTLTYGDFSQSWSVTVREGASDPVAGFSYTVDGLTVHVTSTAVNATQISYRWATGGSFSPCATAETSHTYDTPGSYVITQKAVRSDGGTIRTDEYSATVTITAPDEPAPPQHDTAWSAAAVMVVGVLLLLVAVRLGLVPLAAVGIAAVVGGAVWWFF